MVALFLENTAPVKQTERAHTSTLFECKRSVRGIQAIKGSTWCNHASNAIPCSTNENGGKAASAAGPVRRTCRAQVRRMRGVQQ